MAYKIRLSPIKRTDAPKVVPLVNADVAAPPVADAPAGPGASLVPVPVPATRPSPFGVPAPVRTPPVAAATTEVEPPVAPPPRAVAPHTAVTPLSVGAAAPAAAPLAPLTPAGPSNVIIGNFPTALPKRVPPSAPAESAVSTGIMQASAAPSAIRASGVFIKWAAVAVVAVAITFLAANYLLPIVNELRKPKGAPVVVNKEASTAVKVIQQTRQVTAKSEANLAYLNEVVGAVDPNASPVKPPSVGVPPPASVVMAPAAPLTATDYNDALARLKIDSVSTGPSPRAYIDGRLIKFGDIVDRKLGLRFVGVDPEEHVLLFTNADNVTFQRRY